MKQLKLEEARVLHEAGKHAAATVIYREVLEEEPACEEALYRLAIILAESGDYADSVLYLQRLLLLNQTDPRILLSLANVYTFMQAPKETYTTLKKLIEQFPDYAPAYHNLGVYFYRRKEWQPALDAFLLAISKQSNYVDAYYHLGLLCFTLQRFHECRQYFHAVLQLDSLHVGARFHLACVHLKANEIDQALALFQRLHDEHPYHFETLVNMSHCYLAKNELEQAVEVLEKATFLSPSDTQVLFNLGVISYHQHQIDRAIRYYELVLENQHDDISARYNLALIYLDCSKVSEAAAHLQLLTQIAPEFEQAHYLLEALSGNETITAAPASFVTTLFDQYAPYYDAHMAALQCAVPERIHEHYLRYMGHEADSVVVLDLGVGTGKLGELLKPYASKLIGVDMSSQMLNKARIKNIYAALHQDDIVRYLQYEVSLQSIDCIVAADSLLYIGDLAALIEAVACALKPGAYFIFNVEKADDGQYHLESSGRFSHSAEYIDALLVAHQFEIRHFEEQVLRHQHDTPVMGYLYVTSRKP